MHHLKVFFVILILCLTLAACQKECIHEYDSQITQAASCTQEGVKTFTCSLCEHSYTAPVPMTEHTYAPDTVEKEATCSEEGVQKYICADCGAAKNEPIDKLPHTFGESILTKEPNCSEEGEISATCTICNTTEVVGAVAKNDVHIFTNQVVREATCSDTGEGINICDLCGHSEPCEYELKEHQYGQSTTTVKATCAKEGKKESTCIQCGHVKTEAIAVLAHSWGEASCNTKRTCTVCGQKDSKTVAHQYVTTENSSPGSGFAGISTQKCEKCGVEKTTYIGNVYKYDLSAIRNKLVQYAKSKGLQVSTSGDDIQSPYITRERFTQTELYARGPDYLVKLGKECIDKAYNDLADKSSTHTVCITVLYETSYILGGSFVIRITVTS